MTQDKLWKLIARFGPEDLNADGFHIREKFNKLLRELGFTPQGIGGICGIDWVRRRGTGRLEIVGTEYHTESQVCDLWMRTRDLDPESAEDLERELRSAVAYYIKQEDM